MESDPIKDFNKIKEKVEKVFQEFESTSDLNLKNKSFNQYSKYIDKLVDIKNPTEEIDDYIFECIARAKGMRKKITVTPETETIVDKLMRVFLLEQEPDLKWGDIIGLKPHREIFLNKVILPAKRKKFEDAEKKILLFGGPGTGKTILAKAMAFETEYVFFNVHCSNLITTESLENSMDIVKELFNNVEKYQPCIIFIDEFDLLYPEKSCIKIEILSELLWERIENIKKNGNVAVFSATNKPWNIPKHVYDHFDLKLILDVPDQETRVSFLNSKLKDLKLENDFIQSIATQVKG